MPSLRCSVRNCSHNKEDYCTMAYIEVGGEQATNAGQTCCANFDSTEYAASNTSHECQTELDIKCLAHGCLYNRDMHCTANTVAMSGATTASCIDDTQCSSFWSL